MAAYPRVLLKEHDLLHSKAVQPALTLLSHPMFSSASKEFLDALEDYRKTDYGDCLTKCSSAFESVLKIICHENKWPYRQTDTAATLLDSVIKKSGVDPFFSQPFMLIATMRNRLSKSHGAGTETKEVPAYIALYAINATASAILFIVASSRK